MGIMNLSSLYKQCGKENNYLDEIMKYFVGGWFLLVFILGAIGNFVTIISISYAARKKRFGFDENFNTTGIFICNLSFLDLCLCIFFLLPNGISLLMNKWLFGELMCSLSFYASCIVWHSEILALSLIAISRCLDLKFKERWDKWSEKMIPGLILIVTTWIPGILFSMPFTGFHGGWSYKFCMCDYVRDKKIWRWIGKANLVIGICVMGVCYIIIWWEAKKSVENVGISGNLNSFLKDRNKKMTNTISRLLVMSVVCFLPWFIINEESIDSMEYVKVIYYIIEILYGSQVALNFILYVMTNDQYRLAYKSLWDYVICKESRALKEYSASLRT